MRRIIVLIVLFPLAFLMQGQNLGRAQLDSLIALISQAKPDTQQVWILSDLSRTYIFINPDSGLLFAKRQLDLSIALKYKKGEVDAKTNIALYWWTVGEYSVSIKLFTENIVYYREIKSMLGLGDQYGLMFNVYRDQGDFDQAFLCLRFNDSINRVLHNCTDCIDSISLGSIFYEAKQFDSALYYLKSIETTGSGWGWGNLMLGKAYAKSGNDRMALKYFHISVPHLIGENNMKDLAGAYNSLAEMHKNRQSNDSALYYANKALKLAEQNKFNRETLQAYLILSDIRNASDPELALHYLRLAFASKDTLYNLEKQRQISGYRFTEELNRQQAEATKKQYQNTLKTTILFAVLGFFIIISTFLYRNNRQKQAAKKKVEMAYDQLKSTQKQLIQSEKMASLGELTAGIAHEIQNPLNFVNNFSEVNKELISELVDEADKGNTEEVKLIAADIRDNSEKINHHGKRADSIVKGMLQHSRSNTGHKELTDINALADEYLRLAYHGFRAKDKNFNTIPIAVGIKTEFDTSIGKINIAPQDIGRVLLNLYNNAFYAVNEKAKGSAPGFEPALIVSTKKNDNRADSHRVEITVRDNGSGFPQSMADKIFQPFFTTKPTGQGTGLGLSLAYDIITKEHNGTIKAESREGEGSTFIIQLPTT